MPKQLGWNYSLEKPPMTISFLSLTNNKILGFLSKYSWKLVEVVSSDENILIAALDLIFPNCFIFYFRKAIDFSSNLSTIPESFTKKGYLGSSSMLFYFDFLVKSRTTALISVFLGFGGYSCHPCYSCFSC